MFRESLVALVTPMTREKEIDWRAFEGLVNWQIAEGTNGLLIGGTTGEGMTLSAKEKKALFQKAVEIAKGRIPIIAATGSGSTQRAVESTRVAKEAGVSGALVIVPYYNRPSELGCLAHYTAIAEVDLPLILYHHPRRTGVCLSAEAIARICEIPQVVGVKEASGDMNLALELIHRMKKPIFSGDDLLALPHLAVGCSGVISIIGNLLPQQWGNFVRSPSAKAFFLFYRLCRALLLETNPQGIKYALSLLGKCEPILRLPLVLPELSTQKQIEEALTPLLTALSLQ
jgi:4-hydroxy-tetrahydrodipicolinate synthase